MTARKYHAVIEGTANQARQSIAWTITTAPGHAYPTLNAVVTEAVQHALLDYGADTIVIEINRPMQPQDYGKKKYGQGPEGSYELIIEED